MHERDTYFAKANFISCILDSTLALKGDLSMGKCLLWLKLFCTEFYASTFKKYYVNF